MDGWNTNFLLGWPIFKGENVSFRECRRFYFSGFSTRNLKGKIYQPTDSVSGPQISANHWALFAVDLAYSPVGAMVNIHVSFFNQVYNMGNSCGMMKHFLEYLDLPKQY